HFPSEYLDKLIIISSIAYDNVSELHNNLSSKLKVGFSSTIKDKYSSSLKTSLIIEKSRLNEMISVSYKEFLLCVDNILRIFCITGTIIRDALFSDAKINLS